MGENYFRIEKYYLNPSGKTLGGCLVDRSGLEGPVLEDFRLKLKYMT